MRLSVIGLAVAAGFLALPPLGAEVERLVVERRDPVAEGRAFGLAGPYERLQGTVHFAVDPEAPGNAAIVDLDRAPRREDGRVEFSSDFYLIRPVEPERGSGTTLMEIANRGGKAMVRYFQRGASGSRDPIESSELGDGFLLRRGLALAWLGWQWDVPEDPELVRLHAPRATLFEPPIEGLVRADHVFSQPSRVLGLGHRGHLAYPVAEPTDPRNVLTVRDSRLGERRVIPRGHWRFARELDGEVVEDPGFVHYPEGFEPGRIYEIVYVARDPVVEGLGHAAIRDFVAFLKRSPKSPVPTDRVLGFGVSQTGRHLRHFLYQGFNTGLTGRRVFDGLLVHTAGAGRGSFNHRFGQPSRDAHRFSAFWYPTDIFPFTGMPQHDPETDLEEGLLDKVAASGDPPKIFFTNSGYEYWGRAASLIHTTIDGTSDMALHPFVRIFHFASAQHFVGGFPPEPRESLWNSNPVNFFFALRGLLAALEDWVGYDVDPPESRYPRVATAELVPAAELDYPAIPGGSSPPLPHVAHRADYGPRFRSAGIVDLQPPRIGKPFGVLVPQIDEDGNELGGLRLPEVAVPLATYTPWNLREPATGAAEEMADFVGAFFPFPATRSAAESTGDGRRSIEERYTSREAYLGAYSAAAVRLVRERLLLAEDLPELLEHADELWELVSGNAGGPSH